MKTQLFANCSQNKKTMKREPFRENRKGFWLFLAMFPALFASSSLLAQSDGAFRLARSWNTGGSMLGSDTSFSLSGNLVKGSESASYNTDAQADSFFKILGFRAHVLEGNAAASFELEAVKSSSPPSYNSDTRANASFKPLGFREHFLEGNPEASPGLAIPAKSLDLTSAGNASLNLRVMGLNIASFRRDFVRSDSMELARFTTSPLIKEVTFAEQRFMVGPVPVRVAAGASIEMRGEGIVQMVDDGGAPGIETRMGPVFDAALVATGAVDAFVAAAGVKAKASLAKAAMNGFACLKTTVTQIGVDYGLDIGFMGTNGELSVFARALLPGIVWRRIKIGWFRISIPLPVLRWHEWSTALARFGSAWETISLGQGHVQL